MKLALKEAWKHQLLTYPNPAVGALLLDKNKKIIAIKAHKRAGMAHAEVRVLKKAFIKISDNKKLIKKIKSLKESAKIHNFLLKYHNNIFKKMTLFVTLEPCSHYGKTPPCSLLISQLKISKVVIGTKDLSKKAGGGIEILNKSNTTTIVGVLEKRCKQLIEPFRKWSSDKFIFFKYAQYLNGVVDGGQISSKKSLKHMHKIRDKVDLIVIGGNTVRTDRPTLDSRLIQGKSPDILIYSKQKEFDQTIPLFSVPNRKVYIDNSFKILEKYNFIMIEGVGKLAEILKDKIDWFLIYQNPNFKKGLHFSVDLNTKLIYFNSKKLWLTG